MSTTPYWKREGLSCRQLTAEQMWNERYIEKLSFSAIGEKARVSGERVRQILLKEEELISCQWLINKIYDVARLYGLDERKHRLQ